MAFKVEDGTGFTDATSFASVQNFKDYWTDRGNATLAALDDPVIQVQLVLATDYLRNTKRYDWSGFRNAVVQRLPWPRTGAYERNVGQLPANYIPNSVIEAVCYLASRVVSGTSDPQDLQPDLAHGGMVTSESVGDLHVSYDKGASPETVINVIDGLLIGLTKRIPLPVGPSFSQPTDSSPVYGGLTRDGVPTLDPSVRSNN